MTSRFWFAAYNLFFLPLFLGIVKLLDEALKNQWCIDQGFNRSDLVRHLVRIGLKNFESNQPSQENFE